MKKIVSIGLLSSCIMFLGACNTVSNTVKKPNVLLILVDDLGWADVAAYNPNTSYSTPNMDLLAKQGLMFTDGYAASPVCSPTRASLITGMDPTTIGTTDFFRDKSRLHRYREGKFKPAPFKEHLPKDGTTIASVLKHDGYDTAFIGKWHLGQSEQEWPEYYGFDINIAGHAAGMPRGGYFAPYDNPRLSSGPDGEYLTDRLTTEAVNLMGDFAGSEKPFLLMMSYYSVHTPLEAPEPLVERYAATFAEKIADEDGTEFAEVERVWPLDTPKLNRVKQTQATYAAMVEKVDENIGRLVTALTALNLKDDTIVVLLSDNGGLSIGEARATSNLPLRGGKGWLYEGGIRVPFVLSVPGSDSQGRQTSVPAISTDIAATLYELLGINNQHTKSVDGESLVPLINGHENTSSRPLFFHYPHYSNQGGFPGAVVRLGEWKLIERFEDGRTQLFNLQDDRQESQDLASQFPDRVADMKAMLHQWYAKQDAKFLRANPDLPEYGKPWEPADE